jgi:hypothetical protein
VCLTSTNRKPPTCELRGPQRSIPTNEAVELVKTYQDKARARAQLPLEIEPKLYAEVKDGSKGTGWMRRAKDADVFKNVGEKQSAKQRPAAHVRRDEGDQESTREKQLCKEYLAADSATSRKRARFRQVK